MAPVAPDLAAAAAAGAARFAPGAKPILAPRAKPIYLILMAPSYSGSSALEGLLSTSPSVTTMCNAPLPLWECESTMALIKYGVFSVDTRWDPEGTDWALAYRVFNNISIWDNMSAPIRLEKAPPNIAKSKSLVRFFEAEKMDYRFLVMRRSGCLMRHKDSEELRRDAYLLDEVMANGPPSRTLEIQYEDLVVDTRGTAQRIVNWLPQLGSLSLTGGLEGVKPPNKSGNGQNKNKRQLPIVSYVQSPHCVVRIQRPGYCAEGPLPKVMPGGHGAVEAHFDRSSSTHDSM